MRRQIIAVLIAVLGVSILSTLIVPVLAQASTSPTPGTTDQQQLVVRWMGFRGAVTNWGDEPYHGWVGVTARTANVPPSLYRPWVMINAVWSNEDRPMTSTEKPVGTISSTQYVARLVLLQEIRGKAFDPAFNLIVTGLWNVNKVIITAEFDENGVLVKHVREATPVVTMAKGQLLITDDWKKFEIQITGIDDVEGKGLGIITSAQAISPFSYSDSERPTMGDLLQLAKCYRAMPGLPNYIQELDYNMNSKIDLRDLTTVAANM